ncbi:hypothetical protein LZQ00_15835 [Sphingobacterium sp. SRCM116780]|uniref:hypothetical protein n=1 Tax=Sphingobacterium sp. SRCM116780 TaxID=2907623 RepID=UPI001F1C79B6|nr:hypothetical protein [Sphingobacterium sp. SRCM116780]UIR55726.1 hypothetical protein LZQ00_15835 [Sphingobacterium sp. SRCM116780]
MKRTIKTLIVFSVLCFLCTKLAAQEYVYEEPTAADRVYRTYREQETKPTFGLIKVEKLIKKIKEPEGDMMIEDHISALSKTDLKKLNLKEQFTYVMIHPEMYSQACVDDMTSKGEEQKIFGVLTSAISGVEWSEDQRKFLKQNRDTVQKLIFETIRIKKHMGVNLKAALIEISAWESIPAIIRYYQANKKDKDALTVLSLILKKGKDTPYLQSRMYQKLYGDDYSYTASVNFNQANEQFLLSTAQAYFKQKSSK